MVNFGEKVRKLDIFKKVPSTLSQSTNLGGVVSLITAGVILYLIYRETHNYLNPEYIA